MTGTMLSMVYPVRQTQFHETSRDQVEWSKTHLLNDTEAVRVVAMEDIRAHECEHRHDIPQDGVGCESCQCCHEEEGLVERLWVVRRYTRG